MHAKNQYQTRGHINSLFFHHTISMPHGMSICFWLVSKVLFLKKTLFVVLKHFWVNSIAEQSGQDNIWMTLTIPINSVRTFGFLCHGDCRFIALFCKCTEPTRHLKMDNVWTWRTFSKGGPSLSFVTSWTMNCKIQIVIMIFIINQSGSLTMNPLRSDLKSLAERTCLGPT